MVTRRGGIHPVQQQEVYGAAVVAADIKICI
jgi:hypothetical protein